MARLDSPQSGGSVGSEGVAASLAGPRRKLAWANDHIASLDNEIGTFFGGGGYSFGSDFDQETEDHVVTLRITEEAPLLRWSPMVGDVLHNLRSALDYLIYQLAIEGSGQDPPPNYRELQFPIFTREDGNRGYDRLAPKQIKGVPGPAQALLKTVQPFDDPSDPLWTLRELSNADKHRTLHLTVTYLQSARVYDANTVGITSAASGIGYEHPDTGERIVHVLYDGMELSRQQFGTPAANRAADVKVDATFDVLFDEGTSGVPHEVVTQTLDSLSKAVSDVIDTFEPFLPMPRPNSP